MSGVVVSRSLGPAGRATYALPLNFAQIMAVITALSLDSSTAAMVARGEASVPTICRFLAASALALGTAGLIVTTALGDALSHALLAGASPTLVLLAALSVPLSLGVQFASTPLVLVGALRAFGWALVAGAASQLAFIVTARILLGSLTPAVALIGMGLGLLVSLCGLAATLGRRFGPLRLRPRFAPGITKRAFRGGFAVQPSTLFIFLNLRVDLLIVGVLTTRRQAGFYSLSTTLASIVFLAASQLAIGAMARQTHAPLDEANRYTRRFIAQSTIMTAAAASIAAALAWPFVYLAFGRVWTPSVLPLVILMFAAVSFAAEGPARTMLIRMERTRLVTGAAFAGLIVNVACNLLFIPPWGIVGAALASLVSYTLYTAVLLASFLRAGASPPVPA